MRNLRNSSNRRTTKIRNLAKPTNYHLLSNNSGCPSATFNLTWLGSDQEHVVVLNPWDHRPQQD